MKKKKFLVSNLLFFLSSSISSDGLWRRENITPTFPEGTEWVSVASKVKWVSVGIHDQVSCFLFYFYYLNFLFIIVNLKLMAISTFSPKFLWRCWNSCDIYITFTSHTYFFFFSFFLLRLKSYIDMDDNWKLRHWDVTYIRLHWFNRCSLLFIYALYI